MEGVLFKESAVEYTRYRCPVKALEPRVLWWSAGQLLHKGSGHQRSPTLVLLCLWGGPAGSPWVVWEKQLLPFWVALIQSFNFSQPPFLKNRHSPVSSQGILRIHWDTL